MSYKVVVNFDPETKRITKYQDVDTESQAKAHVAMVTANFPDAFYVEDIYQDNYLDYLVVDSISKTLTPNDAVWDAEQAELAKTQYQRDRKAEYPPATDYLDGIVKGDQAQIDKYIADCLAVKERFPK